MKALANHAGAVWRAEGGWGAVAPEQRRWQAVLPVEHLVAAAEMATHLVAATRMVDHPSVGAEVGVPDCWAVGSVHPRGQLARSAAAHLEQILAALRTVVQTEEARLGQRNPMTVVVPEVERAVRPAETATRPQAAMPAAIPFLASHRLAVEHLELLGLAFRWEERPLAAHGPVAENLCLAAARVAVPETPWLRKVPNAA